MPQAFVLAGGSWSQLGLLVQARALGHAVCVIDGAEMFDADRWSVTESSHVVWSVTCPSEVFAKVTSASNGSRALSVGPGKGLAIAARQNDQG